MRIALIGAGAIVAEHSRSARTIGGLTVTSVCDLDADQAAAIAAPWKAAVYTDYRDLLTAGDFDAVIIATPHALHHQMTLDALAAGADVLVEKPMATTTADCQDMMHTAQTLGRRLAVGHIQHFLPEKVAARAALMNGDLGTIRYVTDHRSTDYRPGSRPEWFFNREISGGGAVMNIGAHMIDRCAWLSDALPVSVRAHLSHRFEAGVETDGHLDLVLDSGVHASVTVTSTVPREIDEVLIVGETSSVLADPRRGTLLNRNGRCELIHSSTDADIPRAFDDQLRAFRDLVHDGTTFPVSLALSYAVIATVLAGYESHQRGEAVTVSAHPDLMGA